MAKISALPNLAPQEVDGSETLPVVKTGQTLKIPAGALVDRLVEPHVRDLLAAGQAQITAAEIAAARAEAAELVLEITTAGGWFDSESDPDLLALPNGTGAFINPPTGDFYTVEMVAGTPVRRTTFLTDWADRGNGIRLWNIAKGDCITVPLSLAAGSNALRSELDRFTARDVGKRVCIPGAGPGGRPLAAVITAWTDARNVVLSVAATTAVTGALVQYGTDDTAAVQMAINVASATGRTILCGGPEFTYLIAGEHETLGTFTHPTAGTVPFKRGILRLKSNVHFLGMGTGDPGTGARFLLSGGRTDPGQLFHHPFWEAPGSRVENVSWFGVELDGNYPNQYVTPYPANTPDNQIWQHGHGIAVFGVRNWHVDMCCIHGFRGAGVNLGNSEVESLAYADRSRGVSVLRSTFYDNFSHDIGTTLDDVEIAHNTFRDGVMRSRWVHAVSCEKLDPNALMNNIRIHHNLFDFRYGYRPVESEPQFASDDPAALAIRKRYRRAVSFSFFYGGFPNNVYNGTMRGISVTDNTIYQGSIDVFNWTGVTIARNEIYNFYEDFGGDVLHAITVNQSANSSSDTPFVVGLTGALIHDNTIDHDLNSYGIQVEGYTQISVRGGSIKRARAGGVRINGCSGTVHDIDIVNVGRNDDANEPALVGMFSSGVTIFGGSDHTLSVSDIRASDTRGVGTVMKYAVYANVGARPITRVQNVTAQGVLRGAYREVTPGTVFNGGGNLHVRLDDYSPLTFEVGNLHASGARLPIATGFYDEDGALLAGFGKTDNGDATNLSFFDAAGLQAQMQFVRASGNLRIGMFDGPTFRGFSATFRNDGGIDLPGASFAADGKVTLEANWQKPIKVGVTYNWPSDTNVWRSSTEVPTSDSDGVAVGSQV